MHVGQIIEQQFREQGHTVTWFANQLCCTRADVYKIFSKDNIDVHLLLRISRILRYDFFKAISQKQTTSLYSVNEFDTELSTNR